MLPLWSNGVTESKFVDDKDSSQIIRFLSHTVVSLIISGVEPQSPVSDYKTMS